jgi:hypothetical protein
MNVIRPAAVDFPIAIARHGKRLFWTGRELCKQGQYEDYRK